MLRGGLRLNRPSPHLSDNNFRRNNLILCRLQRRSNTMNSPAQRHVTQGLDRCAADDGQFGDLARLQLVRDRVRHFLHFGLCIPNRDQAFRLIETTHSGRSRPACGRVYGPRRMIRAPLQTPRARLPMRKMGDMLRLSAAGLLRLALAQIMHCATRGHLVMRSPR